MISQDTIQQIINRIDIIEVVGDYVHLKKRGTNYLGNCPFHNEKSPSFTVSPSKEIYKCFGCGKSGNAISFMMDLEKLSYVEALKKLAQKYNVEVEETYVSEAYKEQQRLSDSLYILNQFAAGYFKEQLLDTEVGRAVGLSYLKQRSFTQATIDKFLLGYNPAERAGFAEHATKSQYNPELLVKSGLVVNRDGNLYDNYRDRIIFPIQNAQGKIIGFGARLIKKNDKAPKYINTPENEIYVKSKVLYGIYQAKQAIDKADECLLVEGYTDVISLSQAGVENVVASGGTSLTQDQLRIIKKYTDNLTIIYDGDGAGIKAALRGLNMALEEGLKVRLVLIPDGEDPDSYVNKVGKDAFNEFVANNKKDFIIFQAEIALKDANDDPAKRNDAVNTIAESLSRINRTEDFTLQQDYIRRTSALLNIDETGLTNLVNKYIKDSLEKENRKHAPIPEVQNVDFNSEENTNEIEESLNLVIGSELQERAVIRALLQHGLKFKLHYNIENPEEPIKDGVLANYIFQALIGYSFDNVSLNKVYETYKEWFEAGLEPTEKSFLYYDDNDMSNLVISIVDFPYSLSDHWRKMEEGRKQKYFDEVPTEDVINSVDWFRLRKIKLMLESNQKDLLASNTIEAQVECMQLHMQLKKYEQEITKSLGTVIFK
ncbi:DNA primase [Polluticaenibacter yanchengensis]|uniref:DNA primase n=1 Tax=Polluticaenibacter yanchengensis TaxID=3014562 RepID=A0ABT4UM02_9BACT|nr:DNA primase [Chitinophagaceae bacterium LY-5]